MNVLGIHFHKWSKWVNCPLVASSPLLDMMSGVHREEVVPGQKRNCEECGIEVIRTIG